MRDITLLTIFDHRITQKYIKRSGMAHAIAAAYHAFTLSKQYNVNSDLATKAAFLHDIGHYTWYRDGKWDYELYKKNDIHAIKGAERAHKLLIRLGEHPAKAKKIALAILLHTDSYLPDGQLSLDPLQKVVALADEMDEEPNGNHHYRKVDDEKARLLIIKLDEQIDNELYQQDNQIASL
ncbi:phosphohydrolase [Anaerobacillus alkalidiazotrophicus]|uniref:Phosphohydrolase n=1 Tax=Anaerobacillus alkalidiazotrophicus TaxID=472963 RepID=A0A1S2M254_9BACI|nr:HD domain-containing protein [Anaerobacillus alkalidiazotrophicus]OIJ18493.1 phosphohydrolase [Anaerobacillus alkalidiazotrophicus]OIJ19972.1 phosphohydrolase [Anaerobacillus alkalidiazotrophicus]